jgi:hypothetical protein
MLDEIQPLVQTGFQVSFCLFEIGHFNINVYQLFLKSLAVLVFECNGMNNFTFFGFVFIIIKCKVQNTNTINCF